MKEICTSKNICAHDSRILKWQVDEESELTLDNWRQKLNLDLCKESWKPPLIGAAFFLGWAVTLLILPPMADKYGRRIMFASGITFSAFLYTIIMFTESLDVMIFISFLFGMITSIRLHVG